MLAGAPSSSRTRRQRSADMAPLQPAQAMPKPPQRARKAQQRLELYRQTRREGALHARAAPSPLAGCASARAAPFRARRARRWRVQTGAMAGAAACGTRAALPARSAAVAARRAALRARAAPPRRAAQRTPCVAASDSSCNQPAGFPCAYEVRTLLQHGRLLHDNATRPVAPRGGAMRRSAARWHANNPFSRWCVLQASVQGSKFQRTPKQWLTSTGGDRQSKVDAIKKVRRGAARPPFSPHVARGWRGTRRPRCASPPQPRAARHGASRSTAGCRRRRSAARVGQRQWLPLSAALRVDTARAALAAMHARDTRCAPAPPALRPFRAATSPLRSTTRRRPQTLMPLRLSSLSLTCF